MTEPGTPTPQKNFAQQILGQWPLAVVLLGVLAGLVVVGTSHWRTGSTLVGLSVSGGGLLRLLLPRRMVGLLAVRNRAFDTIVLLGTGIGILVVAWLVPPQ